MMDIECRIFSGSLHLFSLALDLEWTNIIIIMLVLDSYSFVQENKGIN